MMTVLRTPAGGCQSMQVLNFVCQRFYYMHKYFSSLVVCDRLFTSKTRETDMKGGEVNDW